MKTTSILVIDLESTCFEPPEVGVNEIIEIGYAKLEFPSLNLVQDGSMAIMPIYSRVTEFCTKLTGWTKESLEQAPATNFKKACEWVQELCNGNTIWASWGDYDRLQFEKDCYLKKANYPLPRRHLNIKTLFTLKHKILNEIGMAEALKVLNLPLRGRHHNGHDDALNIATILKTLL